MQTKSRALAATDVCRREALGQRDDRDHVDEVEESVSALRAARGVNQQGHQDQINADLDVGEADRILDAPRLMA